MLNVKQPEYCKVGQGDAEEDSKKLTVHSFKSAQFSSFVWLSRFKINCWCAPLEHQTN